MDFMECLESTKAMDCRSTVMSNSKDKKKSTKKKNGNSSNNNSGSDDNNTCYCKVHGPNNSHNTKNCCKAKKLKAKGKPIKLQKCSPNKSWSHKTKEAKNTSKEELNSLVKEQVTKKMSLYVAQQNKKCSSDSGNEECNTFDLSAFNYKDMKISTMKSPSEGQAQMMPLRNL
jgi:hypothetical protein